MDNFEDPTQDPNQENTGDSIENPFLLLNTQRYAFLDTPPSSLRESKLRKKVFLTASRIFATAIDNNRWADTIEDTGKTLGEGRIPFRDTLSGREYTIRSVLEDTLDQAVQEIFQYWKGTRELSGEERIKHKRDRDILIDQLKVDLLGKESSIGHLEHGNPQDLFLLFRSAEEPRLKMKELCSRKLMPYLESFNNLERDIEVEIEPELFGFLKSHLADLWVDTILYETFRKAASEDESWRRFEYILIDDVSNQIDDLSDQVKDYATEILTDIQQTKEELLAAIQAQGAEIPQKEVWNLPPRNKFFTGREEQLEAIDQGFEEESVSVITQSISGLGGVGKTQLAMEYASRNQKKYDVVYRVTADTLASFQSNLSDLGLKLGLFPPEVAKVDERLEIVMSWLNTNDRWLLIIDNADQVEPKEILENLPSRNGHILITSRNPNWDEGANVLTLDTFDRGESIKYLESRTGVEANDFADHLAELLGDLPLALAQAGAYISQKKDFGIGYGEYIELFNKRREEVWQDRYKPLNYEETVATTWHISMVQILEESEASYELMQLLSFFAPEDIPYTAFIEGKDVLSDKLQEAIQDELSLLNTLEILRKYSMVEVAGEYISMHRLVQGNVRQLEIEKNTKLIETVIKLLTNKIYNYRLLKPETWDAGELMTVHILEITKHSEENEIYNYDLVVGLERAGSVFRDLLLRFELAKSCFELSARIAKNLFAENHKAAMTAQRTLASIYFKLEAYEEAREISERLLVLQLEKHGEDHPAVAEALGNLGAVTGSLEDYELSKTQLERAIVILENAEESNTGFFALTLGNLGKTYFESGEYDRALPILERAAALIEKQGQGGAHYIDLVTVLTSIQVIHEDHGMYEEAEQINRRSLSILENFFGVGHLRTLNSLRRLASNQYNQKKYENAKLLYKRALEIQEKMTEQNNISVGMLLKLIARSHQALGEYTDAKNVFERALSILEDEPDIDGTQTAVILKELAIVQGHLEQYNDAIASSIRALELTDVGVGNDQLIYELKRNLKYFERQMALIKIESTQRQRKRRRNILGFLHKKGKDSSGNE